MNKLWPSSGLVLCAFLAATALSAQSLTVKECKIDFSQLPKRVEPTHYKLDVKLDPEETDFTGQVDITLKHTQDASCNNLKTWFKTSACNRAKIFLNADESLVITDVMYLDYENGSAIQVSSVCRSPDREMIIVELSRKPAKNSSGKLRLSFNGLVRTDFTGLFRANYRDSRSDKDKPMVATQFKPGHARKMFPCFDEPTFKATFELGVEHPARLSAVANMRPLSQEHREHGNWEEDTTKTYFGTTPKMSTYLLAFAVGEFDRLETSVPGSANMALGIYTPSGRSDEAQSSLDIAARAYAALQEFFGLNQPIDKIDFVSCGEFPGASENWGLVTMEEYSLLHEKSNFEAANKHSSMVTIIQKLAQQWFGNLVTLKWWDDLWLNEGFASWISSEIAEQLNPESEGKLMYLLQDMRAAIELDAQPELAHAIKDSQLKTMRQIEESLDEVALKKASAVIKMLSEHVGPERFKAGLRAYVKANQFGNADGSDLWRALGETSGLDVKQLINSWVAQAGFPLISVQLTSDSKRLEVSQARFLPVPDKEEDAPKPKKQQTWVVPLTLLVSSGAGKPQKIKFVLSKPSDEIKLPSGFSIGKHGHWLKLNADFQGFYRVHYNSSSLIDAMREPIEAKLISPIDRLNLIDESIGLLKARLIREKQLEDMLIWFKNEDHDAVVYLICKALEALKMDRLYTDRYGLFSILIKYYEKTGRLSSVERSEGAASSLMKKLARTEVLKRLVIVEYEPVMKNALELFERNNGNVAEFVRDHVFAAVGKAGTDEQFERVIELIREISPTRVKQSTVRYLHELLRFEYKRREELNDKFYSLLNY